MVVQEKMTFTHHIWQYWTGPMPEHIKLCYETVRKNRGSWELHQLTPATVRKWLPNLRKDWEQIPTPAHQADYIRACLLYRHGGMWLDSDILLISLVGPEGILRQRDHCFYGPPRKPFIGCMGMHPHHKMMKLWRVEMDAKLNKSLKQPWSALGAEILWKMTQQRSNYHYTTGRNVIPFRPRQWKVLLDDRRFETIIPRRVVGVHLFNEASGELLGAQSRKALLGSKMLVSQCFRKALRKR